MATFVDNLKTRRDTIGVQLAAVTNTDDSPYKEGLYRELDGINEAIIAAQNSAQTGEVVEVETLGVAGGGL